MLRTAAPRYFTAFVIRHELPVGGTAAEAADAAATHLVRRLSYYNHEASPSANDALPRALRWLGTAAVLHAPLQASQGPCAACPAVSEAAE